MEPALCGPTLSKPPLSTCAMLPTTRADALDVDRGETGQVTTKRLSDPRVARQRNTPAAHQADVIGRATGIGDDDVCAAFRQLSEMFAGNWRQRGTGIDSANR